MNKELNLKEIFNTFLRNKFYISTFTFLGLIFGLITSLSLKRTWQGDFQIVLEKEQQQTPLNFDSAVGRALNLGRFKNDDLKTEIAILQSPFVLKDIFTFVMLEKNKIGIKNYQKLRFKQWRDKSLDIDLKKRTKVLQIYYKDNDKDIIIPVLEKISNKYQSYAEEKRLKSIELGLQFFREQLKKYNQKSLNSLKEAQRYAIREDLSILDGNSAMDEEIPNVIDVQAIRVKAANAIRRIDLQLDQINDLKENEDRVIYFVDTIPSLREAGLSNSLKEIDKKLTRMRVIYSEKDENIKDLKEERDFLIKLLTKQVIGYLEAERDSEESKFKAAERPEGVLVKYKTLLRNAKKDEKVLGGLENQYRNLLLQKARSKEPWELITKPNLDPTPISPNRKKITLFGLIGGFAFGLLFSMFKENSKNLIHTSDELIFITELPFLNEINDFKNFKNIENFDTNIAKIKINDFEKICFLVFGDLNASLFNSIKSYLKNYSSKNKILITQNPNDLFESENIVFVVGLSYTEKSYILDIKNKLLSLNKNIIGLISFRPPEEHKAN